VGSRAGLDPVVKRKIPSPSRDSNPRSSGSEPSVIPLSSHGSFNILGRGDYNKVFFGRKTYFFFFKGNSLPCCHLLVTKFRSINDLFLSHDFIRLVIC
jgi:hypothetical protein